MTRYDDDLRDAILGEDGFWRRASYADPDKLISAPSDWTPYQLDPSPLCWACRPETKRSHSVRFHDLMAMNGVEPPANVLPLQWSKRIAPRAERPSAESTAKDTRTIPAREPDVTEGLPLWTPPPEPAIVRPNRVMGWSIRREIAEGRLVVPPTVASPPTATFDEDVQEWFRTTKSGATMLVTGEDDATPPQTGYANGCHACVARSLHSSAYHDAAMASTARLYQTITEDATGVRITYHSEQVGFAEEGSQ